MNAAEYMAELGFKAGFEKAASRFFKSADYAPHSISAAEHMAEVGLRAGFEKAASRLLRNLEKRAFNPRTTAAVAKFAGGSRFGGIAQQVEKNLASTTGKFGVTRGKEITAKHMAKALEGAPRRDQVLGAALLKADSPAFRELQATQKRYLDPAMLRTAS